MRTRLQPIHLYVSVVIALTATVLGVVVAVEAPDVTGGLRASSFWVLFALLLVAELRPVEIDHRVGGGCIVLGPVFAVALLHHHGALLTVVALVVVTLVTDVLHKIGGLRTLFNASMYALSGCLGGLMLAAVRDLPIGAGRHGVVLAAVLAGAVLIVTQTTLTAGAIAITSQRDLARVLLVDWRFNSAFIGLMVSLTPAVVVLSVHALWLLPALVATTGLVYASVRRSLQHEREAFHDLLTDLPNRRFLEQRASATLRVAKREGRLAAMVVLDLDRFKTINDTFGHHIGDEVLKRVARRLANLARGEDSVARLGGDEFCVLLADVPDEATAVAAAERITTALTAPIMIDGLPLSLGASAGVAVYPTDGEDTAALLVHADSAMYQSKSREAGASAVALQEHDGGPGRLALMVELSKALTREELSLAWQPQVEVTGRVRCVEALLRWDHPVFGDVPPSVFMPMVESTELVGPVTMHVVEAAFAQLRGWLDMGIDVDIAINLGARNLLDSHLPHELRTRLEGYAIPASRVTLEITEHCLVQEPEHSVPVLNELHDLGMKISIDDFGTGFSSLAYLRSLPVTELKVDRSFVIALGEPRGETLLTSILGLARDLGMEVVAEGVEHEHLRERAFALGFDRAQGFAIARPLLGSAIPHVVQTAEAAARRTHGVAQPVVVGAPPC